MDDTGKMLRIGALLIILLGFGIYGYLQVQEPMSAPPCSAQGFPGRCYHVPEGICEKEWAAAEAQCKDFIKSLNLGPGRLLGPAMTVCRHAKFDEHFPYSRRSTEECDKTHLEMVEWKRRNM